MLELYHHYAACAVDHPVLTFFMLRRECRFARDAGENVFANRNVGKNLSAARARKTVKTRLTLR